MTTPNGCRSQCRGPHPRRQAGRESLIPRSAQLKSTNESSMFGYPYSSHGHENPLLSENGMRIGQRPPEGVHPVVNHEEDRGLLLTGPAISQGEQGAFKQLWNPSHCTERDGDSDSHGTLQDEERLIRADILPLAAFPRSPIPAIPAIIESAHILHPEVLSEEPTQFTVFAEELELLQPDQRSPSPSILSRTWEPMTRFPIMHSPHCLCTSCLYSRVTQISSTSEPYQPSLLSRPEDYWIEIDELSRSLGDVAPPALFHPDGWRESYDFSPQFDLGNEKPSIPDAKNNENISESRHLNSYTLANNEFQHSSRESFAAIPLMTKSSFDLRSRERVLKGECLRIEDELEVIRYMQSHEVFAALETFPQNMKTCIIHKNTQLVEQERILVDQLDSLERHIQEVDDVYALPQSQLLDDEGWSSHSEGEDPTSIELQSLRLSSWDESRISAAKAKVQLDLYNKKWHDIQVIKPPAWASVRPKTAQQIPWPLVLSETLGKVLHRNGGPESSTKSYLNFGWNAHELFCLAFDFIPSWNNQEGPDAVFNFVSYDNENRTRNLKALREQLKLEKVRWHEDKVKKLFGEQAVKDERVIAVWKVVMDLKVRVGDELEELEG